MLGEKIIERQQCVAIFFEAADSLVVLGFIEFDDYGEIFIRRLRATGIRDRPTAPRSPWQNGHTERLIGSIRRECLDHVVVFGERHLRHILLSYMEYYNGARTHLSLNKDTPVPRAVRPLGAFSRNQFWVDPSVRADLISERDSFAMRHKICKVKPKVASRRTREAISHTELSRNVSRDRAVAL